MWMYKYSNGQISLADFRQPVGMHLKEYNRWVKKAQTIPSRPVLPQSPSQPWTVADEHARRLKKAQMGTIEAIKQARESAQQSAEEANRAEVKRILASIAQGRSKGTGLSHDQFQNLRRIAGSGASSSLLSAAIKRFISK